MEKFLILIMGPQGSGKGTQGKLLAKRFNYLYVEMGPALKEYAAESPKDRDEILKYQKKGRLVPDKIVMKAVKYKFIGSTGIVLDGIPRNKKQAQKILSLAREYNFRAIAVYIDLSDQEAIKRLLVRLVCPVDGFEPAYPQSLKKTACDLCGAKLIRRSDDTETVIKERLNEFHQKTEPMIKYLQKEKIKVLRIDGRPKVSKVEEEMVKALEKNGLK